jgi:hypothetical protein
MSFTAFFQIHPAVGHLHCYQQGRGGWPGRAGLFREEQTILTLGRWGVAMVKEWAKCRWKEGVLEVVPTNFIVSSRA